MVTATKIMLKSKTFLKYHFENNVIPIINCPTGISENLASIIWQQSQKKGIIKSDTTDHSPIFFSIQLTEKKNIERMS